MVSTCGRSIAGIASSNPVRGMDVFVFDSCVLSDTGLRDWPITRPGDFYRLWCVIVCDLETSRMRRPWPALGCCAKRKDVCKVVPVCVIKARVGTDI
jgi:hypothetical protein